MAAIPEKKTFAEMTEGALDFLRQLHEKLNHAPISVKEVSQIVQEMKIFVPHEGFNIYWNESPHAFSLGKKVVVAFENWEKAQEWSETADTATRVFRDFVKKIIDRIRGGELFPVLDEEWSHILDLSSQKELLGLLEWHKRGSPRFKEIEAQLAKKFPGTLVPSENKNLNFMKKS